MVKVLLLNSCQTALTFTISVSLSLSLSLLSLSLSLSLPLSLSPPSHTDNGPAEEGLITTENMPYLLQCPVTVLKVDLVSPGLLDSAVWSWAKGYSG